MERNVLNRKPTLVNSGRARYAIIEAARCLCFVALYCTLDTRGLNAPEKITPSFSNATMCRQTNDVYVAVDAFALASFNEIDPYHNGERTDCDVRARPLAYSSREACSKRVPISERGLKIEIMRGECVGNINATRDVALRVTMN